MLSNEALEKITSQMVHDVRTPLTVLGMLHTLLQDYLPKVPELQGELSILKEELGKIDKILVKYRADLRAQLEQK
ncbi:hypothetical protein NO2_0120 [Candidatus Termititenax persephonae]|uniref:histidine kinase n=1 Tax=Candidatus Termititenax persephonae TaxID=2218525 RepID=A0A388TEK8_9BACT|nr:hypothetical protein NO2_0120 [Candidatus Termititenax persephonae]